MTTGRINLVSIVQGAREARARRDAERARAREGRASLLFSVRAAVRAPYWASDAAALSGR